MNPFGAVQAAIDAAEVATKTLAAADGVVTAAANDVDAAQRKLDAATSAKADAETTDAVAVLAYNQALDELSAAAQVAKRPVTTVLK